MGLGLESGSSDAQPRALTPHEKTRSTVVAITTGLGRQVALEGPEKLSP